jgi:YbgC/YbaW family acyl-CoA thioester hydrolase
MSQNEIFQYKLQIKESHLDFFGHVNNAVYAQIYEEARWDFITKNGFGIDVIQKQQIGPVILDLEIRFKREIKNREVITIESQAKELVGNKIIILEQRMINENGKVSSEALFTVGLFDMQSRKLIQATPEWARAVGIHSGK